MLNILNQIQKPKAKNVKFSDFVGCKIRMVDGKVNIMRGDQVVWTGTIDELNKLKQGDQ
jgi:hypothetical protein